MHHVIAGFDIREALDLLALVGLLLFPFLLFPAKDIGLGEYGKTEHGVFVASVKAAMHHHNL